MPIHTIIEQYLQYLSHELNYSHHTVEGYRRDLTQWCAFLSPTITKLDFASVTVVDIRLWMVQLSQAGVSSRTLRRKIQSVRSLYRYLMKRGIANENPAAEVELARIARPLPSHVREQNMNALLDSEVDTSDFVAVRDRLVVMMLYETGMRRAELIGLLDANVDTHKGELKVHGKRGKDRVIPFGCELSHWIALYRTLRNENAASSQHFFVRANGEALYPSLVYHIVHNNLASVGGSSKMSPHVLRHTFASVMLNSGAGLESVKELLGHESLATTQVYTHITFKQLKDNYNHAHPRAQKKGE